MGQLDTGTYDPVWGFACVCVFVCEDAKSGCPGGSSGEVWVHNPEDTGSNPRTGGTTFKTIPPAHPSVKRVPGLVLGSKAHWLCLDLPRQRKALLLLFVCEEQELKKELTTCMLLIHRSSVGYLKLFQLQRPRHQVTEYDCILIDESQDLSPGQ